MSFLVPESTHVPKTSSQKSAVVVVVVPTCKSKEVGKTFEKERASPKGKPVPCPPHTQTKSPPSGEADEEQLKNARSRKGIAFCGPLCFQRVVHSSGFGLHVIHAEN